MHLVIGLLCTHIDVMYVSVVLSMLIIRIAPTVSPILQLHNKCRAEQQERDKQLVYSQMTTDESNQEYTKRAICSVSTHHCSTGSHTMDRATEQPKQSAQGIPDCQHHECM